MRKIVAFDFDGTLTNKDSLLEFIRDVRGTTALWCGFLRYAPILVLMLLKCYPHGKAKEKIFSYFFKGMSINEFNAVCQQFAASHRHLLRPKGVAAIEEAQAAGAAVVIISASVDNWVQPFFPTVKVLGTQIEVRDGLLTGRFLTENCFGQEKVNRLLAVYPDRADYHLTAYGDSQGDRELLAFADEAHYKPFRL
ncbi:MAG: HAD-IB family hydrolase [Prevotella sp.]|nr:HAD-IB family hydrolase [Prevotella sp.]